MLAGHQTSTERLKNTVASPLPLPAGLPRLLPLYADEDVMQAAAQQQQAQQQGQRAQRTAQQQPRMIPVIDLNREEEAWEARRAAARREAAAGVAAAQAAAQRPARAGGDAAAAASALGAGAGLEGLLASSDSQEVVSGDSGPVEMEMQEWRPSAGGLALGSPLCPAGLCFCALAVASAAMRWLEVVLRRVTRQQLPTEPPHSLRSGCCCIVRCAASLSEPTRPEAEHRRTEPPAEALPYAAGAGGDAGLLESAIAQVRPGRWQLGLGSMQLE